MDLFARVGLFLETTPNSMVNSISCWNQILYSQCIVSMGAYYPDFISSYHRDKSG